jgi:transcription initiation factor TFIIIB Brf1 subunit/transcription initiation factor TFIIB
MARASVDGQRRSKAPLVIGAVAALVALAAIAYLSRPVSKSTPDAVATTEAKAYVSHLELSDVKMNAAENFMQQKVVEIEGKISNRGSRKLASVDVYCLFAGLDGREVHRERVPIVARTGPLLPNATRAFRLPFDSLPEGWNEAMPKLVIAQIVFAD